MDLQELASRTGLPLRKLRYVVDHDLVPGLDYKLAPDEPGRPRQFAPDLGFGIACVASLLHGGLQRAAASGFVAAILKLPYRFKDGKISHGHQILSQFLAHGDAGSVWLGDGVNIKLQVSVFEHVFDTKWREPRTGAALSAKYSPRVIVELDIGRLRREIFRSSRD